MNNCAYLPDKQSHKENVLQIRIQMPCQDILPAQRHVTPMTLYQSIILNHNIFTSVKAIDNNDATVNWKH